MFCIVLWSHWVLDSVLLFCFVGYYDPHPKPSGTIYWTHSFLVSPMWDVGPAQQIGQIGLRSLENIWQCQSWRWPFLPRLAVSQQEKHPVGRCPQFHHVSPPIFVLHPTISTDTLSGWWFQPTPLKNDGVSSSVGMIFPFPINMESQKIKPCSSPQQANISLIIINHY